MSTCMLILLITSIDIPKLEADFEIPGEVQSLKHLDELSCVLLAKFEVYQ